MTPETFLDLLIPRWQSTLPPHLTPELVAGFVQRNRPALLQVVAQLVTTSRLVRGALPETADDFQLFDKIVARFRKQDGAPDVAVAKRLMKQLDEAPADQREVVEARVMAFIRLRADAIYLKERGLDAVPMATRAPSLALTEGDQTLLVYGADGTRHVRPGAAPEKSAALTSQVDAARSFVAQIRVADGGRLDRYATTLWSWARSAGAPRGPSPAPPGVQLTHLNDGRWVATDEWREHYQRTKEATAAKRPIPTADYRTFDPPSGAEETRPPDLRTAKWRTEANVAAIRLAGAKEPGDMTPEDRVVLERYSGWGGLSIERVKSTLPPDLVPETFGLIHEYYTPSAIADAIVETLCPLLPELAGNDGVIRALEPSAGVGRLIRAFTAERCLALEVGGQVKRIVWTAIEYSKVSGTLLRALRPDVELFNMPFERWIRTESSKVRGTVALIVSNPPYGERGAMAREDTDELYSKEKRAYAYFMRRALDLLIPGGVGVFLIPAGFLSSTVNRTLREKILLRHHLLGAFRLPSHDTDGRETVPGASVVMDVVFWRSRGGELSEVDVADLPILEGDYFAENPKHVLGRAEGAFAGEDEAGTAKTWRFRVTGDFIGLPRLTPRPICTTCKLATIAASEPMPTFQTVTRGDEAVPDDVAEDLRPALELGRRVGRYLAALGADEAERAAQLWPELHRALLDHAVAAGNPWRNQALRALAETRKLQPAEQLLAAFERTGGLIAALREPPKIEPKFTGKPDDILGQAELLFRQQRGLTIGQLVAFHQRQGGALGREASLEILLSNGWNLDGPKWDELVPADVYLTGNDLWARYDRAIARGDEQARVQARRLLDAIQPALFEDLIDVSPQHGYVPLSLVSAWVSEALNGRYGPIELERAQGFVQLRGVHYTQGEPPPLSPDTLAFLGYINHDPELFRPPVSKEKRTREERQQDKQSLAEQRRKLAQKWDESFRAWVAADPARRERLVNAYNRSARGRVVPTFTPEPLDIARWGPQAPKLKQHQIAGARRVLAQRGGLVAFDVGVGKTYTALAIIARARQEGWVRRPVILVPASLVWKWHDDVLCTLPDYRVLVIGSKRKRVSRGVRQGTLTSEPDTPQERAKKWIALQSGQVDVVILSYDALARTKMNEDAVMAYVEQVEAVARSIALRRRNLEEKAKSPKQAEKLSERERALLEHGARAWVEEILSLPSDWEYDPGVTWDEIGVDMLVVDEAAAFKNLYKPQAREDGVPKFMGGGGEGSDRAWQLDFRAAAVRRTTGGAGIVLLTATPAKNSPLEFYNLIQFIDPVAFTRAGIHDAEQFIDRFLKIEVREVLDSNFEVADKSAVTGFKNLADLRTLIFTYGEFRTAAEVGLKLPRPVVETITITMDDEQEAKYADYVRQIEEILENPSPEAGPSNAILGLLARLSLVALHGALDEGYTYKTALSGGVVKRRVFDSERGEMREVERRLDRPTYESPKLVECAKRVAASPHCGHILFCEPTAVHVWMREVLVARGVPRERIAILNAEETSPQDRLRIAREFNGLSGEPPAPGTCARPADSTVAPKYDVIIANSVAYEGIDLQVRTCTVHHIDLPWTPADLEQRNGRAVRQGNTLGTVQIYYYFADGSTDGYRFSLIDGKAGWLGELIRSQVRDTNNPAAQQQLTPEDILLMISRNKDKTRDLLEKKRQRQAEEARARIAREAARLLRQAVARFATARNTPDAEAAASLREQGEERLSDLTRVPADAWPWAPWIYAAREVELLVPVDGGAPVHEGLRVALPRPGSDEGDFFEFGKIVTTDKGDTIGIRAAGSPSWQLLTYTGSIGGRRLEPTHLPREGGPAWPEDDDPRTQPAIERKISERLGSGTLLESLGWRGASDAFVEKWWSRLLDKIDRQLANPADGARESVPVVRTDGKLALITNDKLAPLLYNDRAALVPPTRAGWQQFLALAPASEEPYKKLREVSSGWFGRSLPPNALKDRESAPAPAQAASAAPSDEPPSHKAGDTATGTGAGATPPGFILRVERAAAPGLEPIALRKEVGSLEEASREYRAAVEASGEGASTFPRGRVILPDGDEYEVSYNGRVWRGDRLMFDSQSARLEPTPPPTLPRSSSKPQDKIRPTRPLEEARRALETLRLPPPTFKRYLKQVEAALAEGKSPAPILDRAFAKAAEGESQASQEIETRPQIDIVLDTFNAEPRWRLLLRETRPSGWLFVVAPEGATEPVAAIDVVDLNVEEVRWLARLGKTQQDEIESRLERALWAAYAVDVDADEGEVPTPLAHLIALMKRRGEGLPPPSNVPDGPPTDDYSKVAMALADLAAPRWIRAEDLERWLVSEGLTEAATVLGRGRASTSSTQRFMRELWARTKIGTTSVIWHRDHFWVPEDALFGKPGREFLLERAFRDRGSRSFYELRKIQVAILPLDPGDPSDTQPEPKYVRVKERFGQDLEVNATVHTSNRPGEFYSELYHKYLRYQEGLEQAPQALADVRTLLYWTGLMLEAPRCQGDTKVRATRAFLEAKRYHDSARESLIEGRTPEAVQRIQAAMERISSAAAEIARSCADGQIELVAPSEALPVSPEDEAAITAEKEAR